MVIDFLREIEGKVEVSDGLGKDMGIDNSVAKEDLLGFNVWFLLGAMPALPFNFLSQVCLLMETFLANMAPTVTFICSGLPAVFRP